MNRNKKLFANSVLHGLIFLMLAAIFLTLAAILGNSNTAREEAEKQKKEFRSGRIACDCSDLQRRNEMLGHIPGRY